MIKSKKEMLRKLIKNVGIISILFTMGLNLNVPKLKEMEKLNILAHS